jgi:hypothetical protein
MPHMTVDEFRTELKQRGFDGFAQGDLDRYIDWGYAHVSRLCRWNWEEDSVTLQVNPGVAHSDLLQDFPEFGSLRALVSTTTGRQYQIKAMSDEEYYARWATRTELDLASASSRGATDKYYVVRNRIYYLPPPDQAMTFVAHYWRRVTGYIADGTPLLPPFDIDEAILAAAEMICHRRMREYEHMNVADSTLQDILGDYISEDEMRVDEEDDRVVPERWR